PRQWAAGDLDGDGSTDVAYATSAGLVAAVLNDGAGNLVLGPVGVTNLDGTLLHAADMDGDGDDDLVGVNRTRREVVVVSLDGAAFSQATAVLPRTPNWANVGSVRSPGAAEVVVGVSDLTTDLLTYRLDAGTLVQVGSTGTGLIPRGFVLADLTGDGFDELVGTTGNNLTVIGNQGGRFAPGPGCGAGEYFMNFNIAFQSRSDPDPVFQLRDLFDDWRSDLVGLTDAVESVATLEDGVIAAGESTTLRIELRDWQGEAASRSLVVPQVIIGGPPTIDLGTPAPLGGGVWEVELTASSASAAGLAELSIIIADAGERPVTLMPQPTLEVTAGCYADLDGDGSLTIFDFLAFQNAFDDGDPIADCDGSGGLDIFDFLCFQNAFDAGC
ncbi:MAG: FG-GAP-like repeat-containing protein, partial [Phycisphaerales bacterium JB064]